MKGMELARRLYSELGAPLLREALPSGPAKGKVSELQVVLADYYESRGWTQEGEPTQAKLEELSLENVNL